MLLAAAVPLAFGVDLLCGEPPARWHPVVGMGRWLAAMNAPWSSQTPGHALLRGAAAWWLGALLCGGIAAAIALSLEGLSRFGVAGQLAAVLATGLLLKPLLAWRMLRDEVAAVETALDGSLSAGRMQLTRLVSRDTRALSAGEVRESALESLSENLNDSLVAPLFWFVVAGLPGAAVYRFANTADAMWGYRGQWEWAGKWAARADDVLSWLPARLSALLLALAAGRWLRGLRGQARLTPSPNSGWPMAALALALDVRLSKPGVYALHRDGRESTAWHVAAGLRLCERAAWLGVLLACASLAAVGGHR
jgi:adenosylcobinamide-phosphate synthase